VAADPDKRVVATDQGIQKLIMQRNHPDHDSGPKHKLSNHGPNKTWALLSIKYPHQSRELCSGKISCTLMFVMLAVSVVMIIQVVALLSIGPCIVEKYTKSFIAMMVWSSLLNVVFVVYGLWMSYIFNVTSGAAIIIVAAVGSY
jgi:hypothetical protein